MASEGDASLIVRSHAERLKEEQQRENQKKEQELAMAQATLKAKEFPPGVTIGFARMPNTPVQVTKVGLIQGTAHSYSKMLFHHFLSLS